MGKFRKEKIKEENKSLFKKRIIFSVVALIALALFYMIFSLTKEKKRPVMPTTNERGELVCPLGYELFPQNICIPLEDACRVRYGERAVWQDFDSLQRACTCISGYHIDPAQSTCVPGDPPKTIIDMENAAEYGFEIVPKK